MHRALFLCCTAALCLLVLSAPAARAGGRLEAEGFQIAVPAGFHRLDESDGGTLADQLRLSGELSVKGEPDVHVFYAGLPSRPDAVLVAARIDLADNSGMRSRLDLQRYVLDNLCISKEEFDALVAAEGVKLTYRKRGNHDALEMSHDGSRGALGLLNEPATRALTVLGDDFILVFVLMVSDDAGVPVEATWQQVSRSLVIEAGGAVMKSLLFYGGAGLAVLVLIVFFVRVRAQRRARMPGWARRVEAQTAGSWHAETLEPDLQPVGGRPPADETVQPSGPDGVGTSLPLPDRGANVTPATLTPSLETHQADNPDAPVAPEPAPWADEELEPSSGPQLPGESHPVPPSDLERPPAPEAPAPKRKGLIRTRPEQGRYSD